MMKLSVMAALVATANDDGESPVANQILTAWGHDAGSARFFRASANFVFSFSRAGQPYLLRFAHESERAAAAVEAEIAYVQYLAAHGVFVAAPLRSLAGRYVESIATPLGVYHAVVFERMSGEQFALEELSLEQCGLWGKALGQLHHVAQGYRASGRPSIHDHLRLAERQLPPHEHAAKARLALLGQQVAALPADERSFGLIHYDFELDNLIWDGQRIYAIDFDDSAWYWFAADLAFAIRDMVADDPTGIGSQNEALRAFVAGYRAARALPDEELALLPLFLRVHNMTTFVKLLRAADIADLQAGPAWIAQLQARLLAKAERYRASFA